MVRKSGKVRRNIDEGFTFHKGFANAWVRHEGGAVENPNLGKQEEAGDETALELLLEFGHHRFIPREPHLK
jgi:hypothetical protein